MSRRRSRGDQPGYLLDGRFPDPPLPDVHEPGEGGLHIVELRSSLALLAEAQEMRNCLGTPLYTFQSLRGLLYIYKVLTGKERATAAIRPDQETGRWMLQEIRGKCNREVLPQTIVRLRRWMDTGQER